MAPPPIALFMTTIASQPALRQRQGTQYQVPQFNLLTSPVVEYILRTLQVMRIPYTTYDLASDPDAKRLWRRKAPAGERNSFPSLSGLAADLSDKQQLPGMLVGGKFPGVSIIISFPSTSIDKPIQDSRRIVCFEFMRAGVIL
jgi:hypothetical protein